MTKQMCGRELYIFKTRQAGSGDSLCFTFLDLGEGESFPHES